MRRRKAPKRSDNYRHPEADALLRPDIGIQPQFRKKKPPAVYRHRDGADVPAWFLDTDYNGLCFHAGTHEQIAVKVIDDRGNELLAVKHLAEAGE